MVGRLKVHVASVKLDSHVIGVASFRIVSVVLHRPVHLYYRSTVLLQIIFIHQIGVRSCYIRLAPASLLEQAQLFHFWSWEIVLAYRFRNIEHSSVSRIFSFKFSDLFSSSIRSFALLSAYANQYCTHEYSL